MTDGRDDVVLAFAFVDELEVRDPEQPTAFPIFDETLETDYCCPRCAYAWSGPAKPPTGAALVEEDDAHATRLVD